METTVSYHSSTPTAMAELPLLLISRSSSNNSLVNIFVIRVLRMISHLMFAIIYNVETILNPILQMRKLRCRVAKSPASVHAASQWWSQDTNTG